MEVAYHTQAERELLERVAYYRDVSPALGFQARDELKTVIGRIAANPRRYHFISPRHRRANLKQFPCHILYEEMLDGSARILVVRHDQRHPSFGLKRK
jgi:plasmid stabilization system protein ParE